MIKTFLLETAQDKKNFKESSLETVQDCKFNIGIP
jgi:hypothetical protein